MSRLGVTPRQPRDQVTEIVATGFAYPSLVVDNDGFFARCRFPITGDRTALIAETRMVQRTWCGPRENTWTMAREAVRRALAGGAVRADEIDLVVVSSCSTIPMVAPVWRGAGVARLDPRIFKADDFIDLLYKDLSRTP